MDVIANIREIRIARKVSQATLAEAIGMSTEGYNRLENRGGNKISVEQLQRIADTLKVPIVQFLGYSFDVEKLKNTDSSVEEDALKRYNNMVDHSHVCFDIFDNWLAKNKKLRLSRVGFESNGEEQEEILKEIVKALNEDNLRMIFFALLSLDIPPMINRDEEIVARLAPYSKEEKLLLRNYMKDIYNL